MPRTSQADIETQLDRLEGLIADSPNGIGRAELEAEYERRFGVRIPSRTMNRRLGALEGSERIHAEGESTARLYRPGPRGSAPESSVAASQEDTAKPTAPPKVPPEADHLPLSPAGTDVWRLIRRPLHEREPVGYNPEFLAEYEPGITWYLPAELRARLVETGRGPDPGRPAGTFARDLLSRLLIDLSWASSKLEGNTYSRLDTQNLIELGEEAEGTNAVEAQMILNHKQAIEHLVEAAETVAFDRATVFALHSMLAENLLPDPRDEGRLRERPVSIHGTQYTPIAIPQVIEEQFDLILAKASAIPDPFEQAFFTMVHIPYLQPFADVNKRTSRLAANISFIRANLCPITFVDVPERAYVDGTLAVYELERVELLRDVFEWAYVRSCARYKVVRDSISQPDPIRLRYRDQLAEVVRRTVSAGEAPRRSRLHDRAARAGIPAEDQEAFVERALDLLLNMSEGASARYRLRPSEYAAWRNRLEERSGTSGVPGVGGAS